MQSGNYQGRLIAIKVRFGSVSQFLEFHPRCLTEMSSAFVCRNWLSQVWLVPVLSVNMLAGCFRFLRAVQVFPMAWKRFDPTINLH